MLRFRFNRLYNNLEVRIKEEKKIDSSWLMGFVQGLGRRKLSGYQFAALVDLLFVHSDLPVVQVSSEVPAPLVTPVAPDEQSPKEEVKPAVAGFALRRP